MSLLSETSKLLLWTRSGKISFFFQGKLVQSKLQVWLKKRPQSFPKPETNTKFQKKEKLWSNLAQKHHAKKMELYILLKILTYHRKEPWSETLFYHFLLEPRLSTPPAGPPPSTFFNPNWMSGWRGGFNYGTFFI